MIYRFGDCELDIERFELRRGGTVQAIEPQVYETLWYLVEHNGRFVGKDELHEAIWHGRAVSETALSSRIKAARRAIGDSGAEQRLIRTVHGRGFCFVAPVVRADGLCGTPRDADAQQDNHQPASEAAPGHRLLLSADLLPARLLTGDGLGHSADAELLARRIRLGKDIERCGGEVLASSAGGLCAGFAETTDAIACAVQLQQIYAASGAASGGEAAHLRLAVADAESNGHLALAAATRLQCTAGHGEILLAQDVEAQVRDRMRLETAPLESGLIAEFGASIVRLVGAAGLTAEGAAAPRLQVPAPSVPRQPSILVLPFTALGSGEDPADFAEGLRIDIQNALVKVVGMLVIAAATANALRGESPERAAHAAGVRYVLSGAVQIAAGRARISLELVDTLAASVVWANRFDRRIGDAFAVQDEITREVLAALDVKLMSGEQARIWHDALSDPKAVRQYYRGVRDFFRMERDSVAAARRCFEAVAELKPDSPIGFTWTALCHWLEFLKRWGPSRNESKTLARHWALEAIARPDADGQAHTAMAHIHLIDHEFDAALEMGQTAIAVRPGCANANGFYGNVLHYCGEQERAIGHVRRAIRLSPVYPPLFANVLAAAYLASGQPEAAMAVAKEVLRINARDQQTRLVLAAAAQTAGSPELATIFGREVLTLAPDFSVRAFCADQPYRDDSAAAALEQALLAAQLPE